MRTTIFLVATFAATSALAASMCPPGMSLDVLDRCVCPPSYLTKIDPHTGGAVCVRPGSNRAVTFGDDGQPQPVSTPDAPGDDPNDDENPGDDPGHDDGGGKSNNGNHYGNDRPDNNSHDQNNPHNTNEG